MALLSTDGPRAPLHPSSGPAVVDADAEGEGGHEVAADPRRLVGMRLLDDLGEHGWSTSARPDGSFSVQGFCADADLWIRWGTLDWKSDWTPVRRASAAAQLALAPRK